MMTVRDTFDRIRLSAFDWRWPGHLPMLVRHLEAYGYARFWTSEHHNVNQSGSPMLVAAIAASSTERIAVGTAGVMLRYASPIRIAKEAHLLELLYPGRIDLGTLSGGVPEPSLQHALTSPCAGMSEDYDSALASLCRFVRCPGQPFDDGASTTICRAEGLAPRLWVCSNNPEAATNAARQGVGLVCHLQRAGVNGLTTLQGTIRHYRDAFVATPWMPAPQVAVVCAGCCAESHEQALHKWTTIARDSGRMFSADGRTPMSTFFLGTPNQCSEQLAEIAGCLEADELAIYMAADSIQASLRGYALLANAFGLQDRDGRLSGRLPEPPGGSPASGPPFVWSTGWNDQNRDPSLQEPHTTLQRSRERRQW